MAWNCGFEFLENCGTWQGRCSQISRNLGSTDCNLGGESGHEPGKPSSEWRNLDALSLGFLLDLNDFEEIAEFIVGWLDGAGGFGSAASPESA